MTSQPNEEHYQNLQSFDDLIYKLKSNYLSESDWNELKIWSRNVNYAKQIFKDEQVFEQLISQGKAGGYWPLVNVLYHFPEARHQLASTPTVVKQLLTEIHGEPDDFIRMRLLFLLTCEKDGAQVAAEEGILAKLRDLVKRQDELVNDTMTIIEMLRCLYNVTHYSSQQLSGVDNLIWQSFLRKCLSHSNVDIVGNAFNVLLNIPLDPNSEDAKLLYDAMTRILTSSTLDPQALDYWSVMALVMARLVQFNNELRRSLRRIILPASFDRNQATIIDNERPTLKNQIITLLGSTDDHKVQATGDLLYALLRGNLSRLIYHFGYGPLAGYLYARGILEIPPLLIRENEVKFGDSSDEELIKAGVLDEIDLVTGQWRKMRKNYEDELPDSTMSMMTEEEKRVETKNLLDLFERLEKNGIIRMYAAEARGPNEENYVEGVDGIEDKKGVDVNEDKEDVDGNVKGKPIVDKEVKR